MLERIMYDECPLCESAKIKDLKVGNCSNYPHYDPRLSSQINWKSCLDCLHVFTEGYYTEEALNILFAKVHPNQKVGVKLEQGRVVSAKMIDRVTPYQNSGVWLDVGFGSGSLLFTAAEYGFHPVGLDLRKEMVGAMKALDFECYCEDVCTFSYDNEIAVISLADVLEHTHFPRQVLLAAKNLLKENGALFLSMPNSESFIWKIASSRNSNPYWGEMEHYHNFSRSRLYSLLESVGFEPVNYSISERYRMCMEVIAISKK